MLLINVIIAGKSSFYGAPEELVTSRGSFWSSQKERFLVRIFPITNPNGLIV